MMQGIKQRGYKKTVEGTLAENRAGSLLAASCMSTRCLRKLQLSATFDYFHTLLR